MNTKKVEKNEYVTKGELREVVHEIVHDAVEEIGRMMAVGFAGVDKRFGVVESRLGVVENRLEAVENKIETIESTLTNVESDMTTVARKSDILNLYEKFVPYHRFDELSLKVYALENPKNA